MTRKAFTFRRLGRPSLLALGLSSAQAQQKAQPQLQLRMMSDLGERPTLYRTPADELVFESKPDQLTPKLQISGGLRHSQEQGRVSGMDGSIGANPAPGAVPDLSTTTVFLGLRAEALDNLTLSAAAELGSESASQHRLLLGARYQVAERTGIYARAETQTGLASYCSLDASQPAQQRAVGRG